MRSFSKYLTEQKPSYGNEFSAPGVTTARVKRMNQTTSLPPREAVTKLKRSALGTTPAKLALSPGRRSVLASQGAGLGTIQKEIKQGLKRYSDSFKPSVAAKGKYGKTIDTRVQNQAAYDAIDARQQDAIKKLEAHKKATAPSFNIFKKPKGKLSPKELAQAELFARGSEGLASGAAVQDYSLETLIPGLGLGMRGARIASAVAPKVTKRVTTAAATGLSGDAARKDITKTVQKYSDQAWQNQNQAAKGLASALTFGQVKAEDQPAPKISTMDIVRGVGDALKSDDASGVKPGELLSMADSQIVKDAAAGAAITGAANILAPVASAATQLPHMADATRSVRTGAVQNIVPRDPVSSGEKANRQAATLSKILSKIQQSAIRREQK